RRPMNINAPIKTGPTTMPIGKTGATRFSMRGAPLLSEGASYDGLATADNLWLSLKVYSSGGENALHAHTVEDHAFVVLQGRGTFYFGDGSTSDVIQYEGIMIPKGVTYRFEADETENLVLLRVGGAQRKTNDTAVTKTGTPAELKGTVFDADGSEKDARN